ncbi:MAG: pyrroline-5-carboxylate reductase [Lachnospiraceae bacterium]
MRHTIGFIGGGNMGGAIVGGLVRSKLYAPEEVMVYDVYQPAVDTLKEKFSVIAVSDVKAMIQEAETIVLCVKPQVLPAVLKEVREEITADKLVISIAAGITIARLEEMLSKDNKIVRVMPNTPALVGAGMAGVCVNANVSEEEKQVALKIFRSFGEAEFIPEKLIDAVVGVSGSSPAYVYMFIEALADGAVMEGMPRSQAYTFAAQAVLGSAKMVLDTKRHPGDLKDMVCSPGGTTIDAVKALEDNGFRATVMEAVHVAAEKNRNM